ncbi:Transcription regulator protein BACH1 BTB and CNC -like protein 1 [Triplophysa tibetana]|uniref:Transcription regulator protein BACH1 BTB and CNC-like protein 1 n=1 Tax=Triplophysa tibetana TaxID=1572043 RepID=A0A5A9N2S5_9TELE|nr:Transcription regulator protein BACH1 BTB and CNC -like protein 1 [Triplophysa tibetana]
MSMDSSKSSKFTFQSSVHSSHVLQCLNEQRKKDLLCDVTVVVENQSFRAHRAVLVSCSDFFSTRVSSLAAPEGLVINLPDEVTTEGFEPLLEFAYTSKLTFTKENVLELRNCATVLGFKNLDKACFDFLLPKFFDSRKSTSKFQRKQCCKTRCCKAREALATGDDVTDENKTLPQTLQSQLQEKEQSLPSSMPTEDATGSQNVQSNKHTDYSFLCPKYRKFQIACGKTRPCLDACAIETVPVALARPKDNCPLNCLPFSTIEDCSKSSTLDLASRELPNVSGTDDGGTAFSCYSNFEACPAKQSNSLRSIEEIEVAKQLTVMPDTCPTQTSPSGLGLAEKALNLKCPNWQLDPMALDCPFFQSFGAVGAQLHDVEGGDTSQGSTYVPSNQSGEDSDSVDTEGDSESYCSERLLEMALPLSVEQIVSLSRNDFQQMLKQQCLSREQLDAVHDIRRRSKNRVAARRCRKRKLDCIYSLEYEIQKLRSEHEKLTAERIQLNQLKIKTWQSYSGLYERVCTEAALKPEQLQVLAKYSSPDCPLSSFLCPASDLPQRPELWPQASTSSPCSSLRTCCSGAKAQLASLIENASGVDQ